MQPSNSNAHYSSGEFGHKEQRQSRYRGYDIKMERRDLCWMVTMRKVNLSFLCSSDAHSKRLPSPNEKPSRRRSGGLTML